jgi:hypothetical protein
MEKAGIFKNQEEVKVSIRLDISYKELIEEA